MRQSAMTSRRRVLAILAFNFWLNDALAADLRLFKTEDGRYQSKYPSSWLRWTDSKDLQIANYPRSKGFHGGLLPPGGAWIGVFPKPNSLSGMTLEEWINHNLSVIKPEAIISEQSLKNLGNACFEIHSREDFGQGVSYEHFDCYFESAARAFAVGLEYRLGDPREHDYRNAYETVIRSFKAW